MPGPAGCRGSGPSGAAYHREARTCPRCGGTDSARIIYGLPDTELIERAERGEVVLGGCLLHGDRRAGLSPRAGSGEAKRPARGTWVRPADLVG